MMMDPWLSIVSLTGWLVLAIGAFAGYKLHWKKSLVMALVWVAIFAGVTGLVSLFAG